MKDIEINDLKTRFFLMKEETLKNVSDPTTAWPTDVPQTPSEVNFMAPFFWTWFYFY